MPHTDALVVFTTVASDEEAVQLVRTLLERRLIACGTLFAGWLLREGAGGWSFVATSVAMGATVLSLFGDLYPRLMVSSTSAAYNLTVQNSASGTYALKVMTVVTAVLFPVVLVYQGWTYYVFRERVRPDSFARGTKVTPTASGPGQAPSVPAPRPPA